MDEPVPIKKLDESVINRIAAGEVIQRPANALKEMIENSIDAQSNNIQVVVKDGGLKLLQITDNGTGIRKDDFTIVCERFTTSKLETFDDLNSISTYGFRGEALASISHVAHLTIQSRTVGQDCAYKASYVDSLLKEPPRPCAGNKGTIITIEDLFYNMTIRKNALKNTNEEFRKISDVLGKYSIHNALISFSLKKYGENVVIKTPGNSTIIDNIRIIYGNETAKELIEFECADDELKFTASGLVTNANYSTKKGVFILFINNRLVESIVIKKSFDQIFSKYLPKNSHPFVYLSLKINPENIDVNVHPTKNQVHFLYEEQIVERIERALDTKLLGSNNSRVFNVQPKLETSTIKTKDDVKPTQDKNLVRTNCTDQKLDKFLIPSTQNNTSDESNNKSVLNLTSTIIETSKVLRKETKLTSILRFRQKIEHQSHSELRELLSQHVFVGCIDVNRALIQHGTQLYLCNTRLLLQELFYQLFMFDFQNFGTITFSKSLPLKGLILTALDLPDVEWTPEDGDKNELADIAVQILTEKTEMMDDYFSLKIDGDGNLQTIPLLLENYIPEMAGLPKFILRLATEVNWKEEKECFRQFALETASYYSRRNLSNTMENTNWKWTTEHVLFPAIKKMLPPKSFATNGVVIPAVGLAELYKIFERC